MRLSRPRRNVNTNGAAGADRGVDKHDDAIRSRQRASPAAKARVLRALARRHAMFLGLLAAGIVLRIIVTLAYRPALVFFDSVTYLQNARELIPPEARPLGYGAFLRPVVAIGDLAAVPVVQHGLALLIAGLVYVLLLRLGVRPWIAALACAPVLLDGYQLSLEQYILSETLFEFLVVVGCTLVLWRRRTTVALAAAAGVVFAMAALTRSVGISVLVVALVTVVALTLPRPWPALALVAAFVVPLAGYATWLHSVRGEYSISPLRGRFLYARVAPFADCSKVPIPPKERILCPTEPLDRRLAVKYYMWSKGRSPVFRVPADSRTELAGRFAERVIRHQPLAYAKTVVGDALHAFAPTGGLTGDDGPSQWRFRPYYPIYERDTIRTLNRYGYAGGRTRPGLGRALRSYQRVVFVHGPLFAAGLIVSLVAILGLGRARRSGLRIATFLLAALAVVLILGPAATADFTFRYRLPLLVLVPPAAALAVTALTGRPSPDRA